MAKESLLSIVQEIRDDPRHYTGWRYDPTSEVPKSTQWARANKGIVKERDYKKGRTLKGKLQSLIINSRNRVSRGSDKIRALEHDIDSKYLAKLYEEQEGLCAISGKEMLIRTSRQDPEFPYTMSLDRIDSSVGYVKGNVQLVCAGVNLMKSTMTMEQFIDFCKSVWEYNNG